ncbi:MAG TPA: TIGR03435 family protein [Bryobacteraceae bacterium]
MRNVILFAFASVLAQAQLSKSVDPALTFEVATVKLSNAPPPGLPNSDGGPGTSDPEHYSAYSTLRTYLIRAFGLADAELLSGPPWLDSEKYAIEARVPAGATREQLQVMLRNLLVERFQLEFHHDTKVLSVYNLVVAKSGPKLKESAPSSAVLPSLPSIDRDSSGFPVIAAGRAGLISGYGPGGQSKWTARQQPMSAFAKSLSVPPAAGRTVIDQTGLAGKYDFTLSYDVQLPGTPAPDTPGLTIFDAVEQQLGLKLIDGKASFDRIVIDHAEKTPAEN